MERIEIIDSYNYKMLVGCNWREKERVVVNGKNVAVLVKGFAQGGK